MAHHFDSPGQQYQAGKTGMWLFLSTEILLFGGLFCAYAVYRHSHPDVFLYAHRYLDKTLGGINTLVLILSSFTAAWAVRAAQMGQRRLLIGLILVTLLCATGFLGIKAVEYEHKWKHGLLWGKRFQPEMTHGAGTTHGEAPGSAAGGRAAAPGATEANVVHAMVPPGGAAVAEAAPKDAGQARSERIGGATPDPLQIRSNIRDATTGPAGLARSEKGPAANGRHGPAERPQNVQVFFGIYFAMTGLHAIHVLAGMTAWLWVLRRAIRGDFSPAYFTPVDFVALYWHLVDLIWIYLFPLLYLIH
jgi:cytochrome c oxidase subunit 3